MLYNSLKTGPYFFLQHFKNKIIFTFVKFVATKKDMPTIFFNPSLFLRFLDPGWVKNQDLGSGITLVLPRDRCRFDHIDVCNETKPLCTVILRKLHEMLPVLERTPSSLKHERSSFPKLSVKVPNFFFC
jgi:hypothetical protein